MIPEEAFHAAEAAYTEKLAELRIAEGGGLRVASQQRRAVRAALEAAAQHMAEVQWGVRDLVSLTIAAHPSEESANETAEAHPEWYEVVSRPMPGFWVAL